MSDHRDGPAHLDRRDLLRLGAAGVGTAMVANLIAHGEAEAGTAPGMHSQSAPELPFAAPALDVVRVGFVGVGGMGSVHVRNLLEIEGVELVAVCDIREAHAQRAATWAQERGKPRPRLYTRGERDFERMCGEEDLDLVYNATPWRWHVPICVSAMSNGKHAATEVPAALTLDECWQLVEEAERFEKHCVMMENVNYGRSELMVLNMVRSGLFGEVLHGEGGYLHDLRSIKFADEGEGLWRREWSKRRNANLYPTHGLGPVANCMDINRGDRFSTLVSMSSPSRGLQLWAAEHYPPNDPKRQEQYVLGDVNSSLIQTALGRTIYVAHDTNLPRPYSRIHTVQGTRGLFQGYPDRVYIEGISDPHEWSDPSHFREEFEHPLWRRELAARQDRPGHGGMDFLEDQRLIYCLRNGLPTDMNVYDAAALSAVIELSERSVASRGAPQEFPDFTRGRWREWPPWAIVSEV
jgi:predicted dehydrogenase